MPTELCDDLARLSGWCSVEEAEILHGWLLKRPQGHVDLSQCTHLHGALLQLLLQACPTITALPEDPSLRNWLAAHAST